MILRMFIFLSVCAVNVAFASTSPSTGDNAGFLMWIIGGLCTVLFTISCYLLAKVDKNQDRLFQAQDKFNQRLTRVETRCEDNHD